MSPDPSTGQKRPVSTALTVAPGDMIGKFRVERIIGRGGMGVVVEATNIQLDQRVALKLLANGTEDPAMVERFSREAKAAARLRSEHVARVYDVGTDPKYGPFIVMEMLEGKTLAEIISTTGRVPFHRAVEYIIDACEGLAEAHARGIVHQDVKPANLFLVNGDDGRPSIKLLDFGIATMRSMNMEGQADPKSSHVSAGTPAYLSPEQLRATGQVDHRADIWALGCVLFELLTGARAFPAVRFTELVTKILETPPQPLPADVEIPQAIAAAILRCLEKDPSKRFTSTGALALTLLPFAKRRAHEAVARAVSHVKTGGLDPTLEMPSSMPPRPSDTGNDSFSSAASSGALRAPGVPSFSTSPTPNIATSPPEKKKSPVVLMAILGLLVLVGVGGFFVLSSRGQPTTTAATPSATVRPGDSMPAAAAPPIVSAAPIPAATTSSAPDTASAAAAPPAVPSASAPAPVVRPATTFRPAPKPVTSASAHPAPTSTESEIRFTR